MPEVNPTVARLARDSRLGFGAAQIGNLYREVSEETADEAVRAAWGGGIRYFDTAPHYGLGLSERRLGHALADKPRDEFVLSTKVGRLLRPAAVPRATDDAGFDVPGTLDRVRDYSAEGVRRSLEESLERMQLDRVDIVYIHDPEEHWDAVMAGAVPELERMRSEGVIGAWGAGMNQTEMLQRFARETDIDLVMLAGRYTLLDQSALTGLVPACVARGIGFINAGVFNSGILANQNPRTQGTYDYLPADPAVLEKAQGLADLAAEHGTTLPAVAIHFSLRDPAVSAIVLGMRNVDHVTSNLELMHTAVPESFWQQAVERGLLPEGPASARHES